MTRRPLFFAACLLSWLVLDGGRTARAEEGPGFAGTEAEGESGVEGRPVRRILVNGAVQMSRESILAHLKTREGSPYQEKVLEEDLRALYRLGAFYEVTREPVKTMGEGVEIVLNVKENEVVSDVTFEGLDELDEEDLAEGTRIRIGEFLSHYAQIMDEEHIRGKYREQGYRFASVATRTVREGRGVHVYFRVVEGPRVSVRTIAIKGNRAFTDSELKKMLETKEDGWFRRRNWDEDLYQADLVRLRSYYRGEGFLDVEVYPLGYRYNEELTRIKLVIWVREGERYRIRTQKFTGLRLFRDGELLERIASRPGEFFQPVEAAKDQEKIRKLYGENAYLDAEVRYNYTFPERGNEVDLEWKVSEDRKMYAEQFSIQGNTLTLDRVIRRDISVYPGDKINMAKLGRSKSRLLSRGYLEYQPPGVNFTFTPGSAPNRKDVHCDVVEGRSGEIRASAGVSSNSGLFGLFSVTKRNFDLTDPPKGWDDFFSGGAFTGAGQIIRFEVMPGTRQNRFSVSFTEPALADEPLSLGVKIFKESRYFYGYDENRLGGRLSLGTEVTDDATVYTAYRNEDVRLTGVDSQAHPDILARAGRSNVSAVELGGNVDKRDDFIIPARGYEFGTSVELVGGPWGGEVDIFKTSATARHFLTLYTTEDGYKHVFMTGTEVGYGDKLTHRHDFPVFERYFAGGMGSVRGFSYRGIGPRYYHDALGGQYLHTGTLEYGLPIYENTIRAVTFYDVGDVESQARHARFDHYRQAVGVGVRLWVPFFMQIPIAVDVATPLDKQDGDKEQLISFSFGAYF